MIGVMTGDYEDISHTDAAEYMAALSADRIELASRVRIPWALMAAFGALGAWWVASAVTTEPGDDYQPPLMGWMALLGVLIVAHLVQRESGIRFRSVGGKATWVTVGIIAICLALFSISLALVTLDLSWAVAMTSAIAFVVTTVLAKVAYRSAVEHLHRA
jgi:multidrug transporter EmrE-like cation transporter